MKTKDSNQNFCTKEDGTVFRILTKKEQRTIKRLDIPEHAKREIASVWAQRRKPVVNAARTTVGPISQRLLTILAITILFLTYYDREGTMLAPVFGAFDYMKNLIEPSHKVLTYFLFAIYMIFTILTFIIMLINLSERSHPTREQAMMTAHQYLKKKASLLSILSNIISVLLIAFLIINAHYWIATAMIMTMLFSLIIIGQTRSILKEMLGLVEKKLETLNPTVSGHREREEAPKSQWQRRLELTLKERQERGRI
jgi:hypothetical protein